MHKFFVDKKDIVDNLVRITGDDVKHIYKVLRLVKGDAIVINDKEGEEYEASIENVTKTEVTAHITKRLEMKNESPVKLYLYQGIPKSSKMDFIVQKGTEIGISKFKPVITKRVVVKNDKEYKKVDRWQRIAEEACKQSKRNIIPIVERPLEFDEALSELKSMDAVFVPFENEKNQGIKNFSAQIKEKHIKNAAIVIGPEGGFEDSEIEVLKGIGAYIVTLGPRILRTETAGIVCAAILLYEFSDMGGTDCEGCV